MFGLFKWVKNLVNNIISQVMQQGNIIQDAVTSPLRAMVILLLRTSFLHNRDFHRLPRPGRHRQL